MSVTLSTVSTVESAASITTQLLGIAAMATLPAAVAALVYRSVAEEKIPGWLAVAVGVSVVALYLGTAPALEVLLDETDPSQLAASLFDIGGLAGGIGGAALGQAVGDRFEDLFLDGDRGQALADVELQLAKVAVGRRHDDEAHGIAGEDEDEAEDERAAGELQIGEPGRAEDAELALGAQAVISHERADEGGER